MGVGTFQQPDFGSQSGTIYKNAIDNSIAALARLAAAFAPHEQATPNMTVRVDAGALWVSGALVERAAQSTAAITAPTTNPRIDRVVLDAGNGVVSVVTGVAAASPSPPAIPAGKLPLCQVALAVNTVAITNSLLTDERVMGGGAAAPALPVGEIVTSVANPATLLGYGTWTLAGSIELSWGLFANFWQRIS